MWAIRFFLLLLTIPASLRGNFIDHTAPIEVASPESASITDSSNQDTVTSIPPDSDTTNDAGIGDHANDDQYHAQTEAYLANYRYINDMPISSYPYSSSTDPLWQGEPPREAALQNDARKGALHLCLADDSTKDFSVCAGKKENDCFSDNSSKCIWRSETCQPATMFLCDDVLDDYKDGDDTTKVLKLSQYWPMPLKEKQALLSGYHSIHMTFTGHGPVQFAIMEIVRVTEVAADSLKRFTFRTFGCASFANRDYKDTKRQLPHSGTELYKEHFEKFKSIDLSITANQLHTFANFVGQPDPYRYTWVYGAIRGLTPVTISISWDAAGKIVLTESDFYKCKSSLSEDERLCTKPDHDQKLVSACEKELTPKDPNKPSAAETCQFKRATATAPYSLDWKP